MDVADIMTRSVLTVPVDLRVSEALLLAQAADLHHLLLTDHGRMLGVSCVCELSFRDHTQPLRHLAPPRLLTVEAECPVPSAAKRFVDKRADCFVVLDGTEVVGVLTRGDLRRAELPDDAWPSGLCCSSCGETRHVGPVVGKPGLTVCEQCRHEAEQPAADPSRLPD